jgi:GWxTD domain-containing protein
MKHGFIASLFLVLLLSPAPGGQKTPLDPETEKFYETARLIMSREEKDIFTHLADPEARKEFIADFWAKRDPTPETEENEFKNEFFNRLEYANKRFKEGLPGWKTDRGRVYIFMGPPDKFEEFFTHERTGVRGPVLWWFYYDYALGIEFVDERNDGTYKMGTYDGDFFGALDSLKLGQMPVRKGERRKFVNFKLNYDQQKREIVINLPQDPFDFIDEGGKLRADLEFQFFVYAKKGTKLEEFKVEKVFAGPLEDVVKLKQISFSFPHDLPKGNFYLDVIITSKDRSLGKTRKIFEIKN